ncbi:uncharacterized protein RHOBADRAFT_53588 [Rhodotorula graminis WP1]|uniref:Uncharacterized protein n=1 Tax=Rhodotorula graminis (strain WP1) TaxID=578459 RepID=A0A194S274_RHOGW|nr:uncharacterized protein RHOBADRAFT_53588 [Rhodotorula graminis WP1]KPV74619.1 hypothetical protein RHOBADRAFT_53588 [Rhodotorula graminis WP1]
MEVQACTASDYALATVRFIKLLREANQADTSDYTAAGFPPCPTFVFSLVRLSAAVAWLVESDSDQLERAYELAQHIVLPTKPVKSHKFAVRLGPITLRRPSDTTSESSEWSLGSHSFARGVSIHVPHCVIIDCVRALMMHYKHQRDGYARLGQAHPGLPDGYDEQNAHNVLALVLMYHFYTKRPNAHLDARIIDGDFRAALSDILGTTYDEVQNFVSHELLPTSPTVQHALAVLVRGLPEGHTPRKRAELVQDVHAALAWTSLKFPAFDNELDQVPRRGLSDHSLGSVRSRGRHEGRRLAASASSRF